MARAVNAAVLTTASLTQDVVTAGKEWLAVTGIVGTAGSPAGAAGDVSMVVLAYMDDATPAAPLGTLVPVTVPLPATDSIAAVLASSRAWIFQRIRVAGIRMVQIQVKNNNAATKPVEANFDLLN
jgi:hypothetical protein